MAYVPPHVRKEQTKDENDTQLIKNIQEHSEKHFPTLVKCKDTHKSMHWEQLRNEAESRQRVESQMAEYFKNLKKEEEITYATLRRIKPTPKPTVFFQEIEPEKPPLVEEDEWTEVNNNRRKNKTKKRTSSDSEDDICQKNFIETEESTWT